MKYEKRNGVLLFGFVLSVLFLQLSSAYYYAPNFRFNVQETVYQISDIASPILEALFGSYLTGGYYFLFEKLLFFILITVFVWFALDKSTLFNDHKSLSKVIAGIVGLIAIRYMDDSLIETIIFSYTWMGVALVGVIPFIVYFLFVNSFKGPANKPIRIIAWAFYVVVYFGLWGTAQTQYVEVYFWAMILGVAMILLDGVIMKAQWWTEYKERYNKDLDVTIGRLKKDIEDIRRSGSGDADNEVKRIEREITRLIRKRK